MLTSADVSPQRIVQRANAVLTIVGDNAPIRVDIGHAHTLSACIRYTDNNVVATVGQFEMLAEVFEGVRWKRVSIENVGVLTIIAGAGNVPASGTQTTFDQSLKKDEVRGSVEVEYIWTLSKRIYAIRFNFLEIGTPLVPGNLENIVTLSVD